MSKVLVVYATKSGGTTEVAEKISETLTAAGAQVTTVRAEDAPVPTGFDAVVVGSGVRVGSWHSAARNWVSANAGELASRPLAFFTCGMTTAQSPGKVPEVRAYTDSLLEATGLKPVDVAVFAGWNKPKEFSLLERTVMGMLKAPQGDFRDFGAIAQWAAGVAPKLGVKA